MSLLHIADLIGIVSFALSGMLIAIRNKLDLLGIILLSFLPALGGGIMRDTIALRLPYSLVNSLPSIVVILTIILAFILKLHKKENIERKNIFIISDSIGLVSFSIAGALVGVELDFNLFGVTILALITATGGGIIRDMIINQVPLILKQDFYGSIAILVGCSIYFFDQFDLINTTAIIVIFVTTLILRIVAYYKQWHLPSI